MHVTRLVDGVTGASDNFADLVKWMLTNTGRVPAALIDTTALTAAATFLEANGLTCNCWLTECQNYSDILAKWAPYFLLGESNSNGKKGLRPLLPTNANGTIKTTAITPEYVFSEDTIIPDSIEIQYTSLADRQPFVAQVTWRQLEDDMGIIRTAEVRYDGTATAGPYESHDLSAFCTSEDHAVKVGAYILAKRVYTTHTVRFTARPQAHNTLISPGDIVRIKLQRQATAASVTSHDYLYQVERITKTLAGDLSYECTHFPVDDQIRSLVALDVSSAVGSGILLNSNKTGVGCDINSSSDNTIPAEFYITPGSAYDPGGEIGTDIAVNATPFALSSTYAGSGFGGKGQGESPLPAPSPNQSDNLDGQAAANEITQADVVASGLPASSSLDPISTGNPSNGVRIYVIMGNVFCNNGACYNSIQLNYWASAYITTTEAGQTAYAVEITDIPGSVNGVSIGERPIGTLTCNDYCAGSEDAINGCYCPAVAYDFKMTNNGTNVFTNARSWNKIPRLVYVPASAFS